MNGFRSKQESIKQIIAKLQPKIIVMCETKLASGKAIHALLPGYEICSKTKKAGQKGLAICVKLQTFKSVLDVTSSTIDDIIVVRIEMAQSTVRIILGYAPQENEPTEIREQFFTELEIEVSRCNMAGEIPIILGDLNAKIEIYENKLEAMSSNGKHLIELINNQELEVLNFHKKCVGKWTHVVRTTCSSSVLDYIITNKKISNAVEEMLIDEECLFCPFNIKRKKHIIQPQFSDHNAIILKLLIPHEMKLNTCPPRTWRITKDGLTKLRQLTNSDFDSNSEGNNIQEMYNNVEDKIKGIMDKCFQVRKKRKDHHIQKEYLAAYTKMTRFARGGKAQRRVAKKYIEEIIKASIEKVAEEQKRKIRNRINNLTINNTFSPNRFWDICKKSRKQNNIGTSIETEEGSELYGSELICNAYMNEFKHRLRKREICEELKNYESRTELLCQMYLEDTIDEQRSPYTKQEFEIVNKYLKKGKSPGRDNLPAEVFMEGGQQLQDLILDLFNRIKAENEIPYQWTQVQISTIYKNKGKRKRLVNQRGIFLKQVLSKMYGKLNMNRAIKSMESIDKFQAGGRANRSPADQTFLIRAAIDHAKYLDQPLFITMYDYSQCFDSLWLSDCLLSLLKVGVEKEVVNILQKLNNTCNIVVKTPAGITEEFEMKSIVQQGSVSGGALCVSSTAELLKEDLGMGYHIGASIIKALAFVDDIATLSKDHVNAYISHRCVEWFSAKKRLQLNALKCVLLCINTKPHHVIPRLKIGNTALSQAESAPYLGDQFNTSGNNKDLIDDRVKKGKACIVNAMSLDADITMGSYSIQTLLLLYKSVFLPIILYNAQAWSNLTDINIHDLQAVQLQYLKRMLHVPSSTSNPLTFLETGTLPVENEIHIKQLTFLHHILTLADDDPVKVTYSEQQKYSFEPNWGNRIIFLKFKYDISETDDQINQFSKEKWKNLIKTKVKCRVIKELKEQALVQKYAQYITLPDSLQKQEYITSLPSANARKIFRIRTGTIDLKAQRKYIYGENTSCRLCDGMKEDLDHVVNKCPAVPREGEISNLYTNNNGDLYEISKRCLIFDNHVIEMEKQES